MEIKLCRICGKQDDNFIHIFKTEGLKNKIETCLPIVVIQESSLPDTICAACLDSVDNFYSFIKSCLQNIIVLEAQYDIIESCLKTKRKVDRSVSVDPCDLPIPLLPIPILPEDEFKIPSLEDVKNIIPSALVDYDSSSSESEDDDANTSDPPPKISDPIERLSNPNKKQSDLGKPSDIIDEIVQRKSLKRKYESIAPSPGAVPSKIPRHEESSSRRKSSRPKRVEYHLESAGPPQTCLLCESHLPGILPLAAHMYEVHGIDLTQVYGAQNETPAPKRKIPELVKISDVIGMGKLPSKLTVEVVGPHQETSGMAYSATDTLEITQVIDPPPPETTPGPIITSKPTMSSLNDSLFLCSECPGGRRPFTSFQEFSTHRRAHHQIFHCDLCPKFYGRNSHLWKHVNRVHKGHSAVTCSDCGKTSASEYHLQQHKNKMHSTGVKESQKQPSEDKKEKKEKIEIAMEIKQEEPAMSGNHSNQDTGGILSNREGGNHDNNDDYFHDEEETPLSGDEDDLLNQKFQGFDFKSVRQSFLRQELMNKRQRYVSVLKKNNVFDEDCLKSEVKDPTPPPKEIDSSSDLYTTIITNYTPPSNEGPYKCPKCLKGFHKKNLVKKHKKNCRPRLQKDLLTRCKTCSRIFKDRQSLAKHLVNYHSEYTCEICGLAVQSKCEIVSHIRFTHPGSVLQCHCGQILRSKVDLGRHKLEHRDSHVCQFCGDQLPTKIKLKMHILSLHRKILALSCGICLKLFETQHVLKAHVKHAHGDQLRPLTSCTVCGKNYGSKWKTYDHLNKSHGRIFKACKACLEVFETERDLQTHFEREHVNNGAQQTGAPSVAPKTPKNEVSIQQIQPKIEKKTTVKKISEDEDEFDRSEDKEDFAEYFEPQNGAQRAKPPVNQKTQKISLLEKRLLGKKSTSESEFEVMASPNTPQGGLGSSGDDILQNSSKRTVYVNSNDPSLCEICLKVWPAKKHLWQHYIRCHKATAATVCGICLKTNPSYSALQRHLCDTHPKLLHGQGFGSNFICKICGRYHNASSKLRLHMAIHVGYQGELSPRGGQPIAEEDGEDPEEAIGEGMEEISQETRELERKNQKIVMRNQAGQFGKKEKDIRIKSEIKEEIEDIEDVEEHEEEVEETEEGEEQEEEDQDVDEDYEVSTKSIHSISNSNSNSIDENEENDEDEDEEGDEDTEVEESEDEENDVENDENDEENDDNEGASEESEENQEENMEDQKDVKRSVRLKNIKGSVIVKNEIANENIKRNLKSENDDDENDDNDEDENEDEDETSDNSDQEEPEIEEIDEVEEEMQEIHGLQSSIQAHEEIQVLVENELQEQDEEMQEIEDSMEDQDELEDQKLQKQEKVKQELLSEDDIYYESLIEEIEASDEENEVNSDDSRSCSPRDLEREMLRNMMCESRTQRLHVKSEPIEIDSEDDIVKFEIEEYEVQEVQIKEEGHVDELDSAIRSICASGQGDDLQVSGSGEDNQEGKYRRVYRVNESELETAVGSIL